MKMSQNPHRQPDSRIRRSMAACVLLSALLVGTTIGVVAVKVQQVRLSYELDARRSARARLEDVNRQLRVELAALRAPARIERLARDLGLAPPARDQVRLAREYVAGPPSSPMEARASQGEVRVR
jgi:cell division protein FtsL